MQVWLSKFLINLAVAGGEKLLTAIVRKLESSADKKEHKNDLVKASKIRDRRERVATMAAHIRSYKRL